MTALLILLYILRANGIEVPIGCIIAVWTIWGLKVTVAILELFLE